ncbi:MAG TPA: tail fiber domain-containing protein, partial [Emticicia sp.]
SVCLLQSQLSLAQSVTLATTTANPTKGTVVYNNTTNQLQYWNGSTWIPVTNAASGTGWALSGTNIYKSNSGNVGIGITNPVNMLQIGSMGSSYYAGNHLAFGNGTSVTGLYQSNEASTIGSNTNIILKPSDGNGNVGINVNQAYNKLQVGPTGSSGISGYDIAIGNGIQATGMYQSSAGFTMYASKNIILYPAGGSGVGINTTSPRGPLDVRSYSLTANMAFAFFREYNGAATFTYTSSSNAGVSIYSQESVLSNQFIAVSDERIKTIVGISNSATDLATVKALQITDYTMKDKIQHGNKTFKKVIAQQVEKVYPQAVSQITDVVPDIYVLARKVVFDETHKTLTCILDKSYNIKTSEKIQLIHPQEGVGKAEVIAVTDSSFTVKDWPPATDKIFVYGREVNDFRSVDYEAISMLGISAIQQLAKENEDIRATAAEMKTKNDELTKKLEQLKADFSARLATIESALEITNKAADKAQTPKTPTGK